MNEASITEDRLPPHDLEMERGILGCQLISPLDCIGTVLERLRGIGDEIYYDLRHKEIQSAIVDLFESGKPVELLTVQQRLRELKRLEQVGGIAYLAGLQNDTPSSANLSYYLDIALEKYTVRKIISTCTNSVIKAYANGQPAANLLDDVERSIMAIRPAKIEQLDTKSLVAEAMHEIEQNWNKKGILGLSTGLADLDKISDGLHPGEMVVIAALPSRGKSSLAGNICDYNALRGVPVAYLSAEMLPKRIMRRSLLAEARQNFYEQTLDSIQAISEAARKFQKAPIYYETVSGFSIIEVKAIVRRLYQKHKIKLLVVDYIQRLNGIGDSMEQKTASISKGIKDLSIELEIPVIALSQITMTAHGARTKYASAIAEDVDSLWVLENEGEWKPDIQKVILKIEKSRDGSTGSVPLTFFKKFTKFECRAKIEDDDVPKYDHERE